MKATNVANTAKKQLSQALLMPKNASLHIKLVKPRPNGAEAVQGPRDCFPLG